MGYSILARHLLTHYARARTYSACCGNVFYIGATFIKMVVYRIPETNDCFLVDRMYVDQMGCRMQEKKSNLEYIYVYTLAGVFCRMWLRVASVWHDRDKEVDGNVSVSKCLVDSGKVYSRGSSIFDDLNISYGDCRDIRSFLLLNLYFFFSYYRRYTFINLTNSLKWRQNFEVIIFYTFINGSLQILQFFKYPYLILKIKSMKNTWYKKNGSFY